MHAYDYGIWWLTVLADAPAPRHTLMSVGQRGFAAQFARGRDASRFCLHCAEGDSVEDCAWSPAARHGSMVADGTATAGGHGCGMRPDG